MQAKGSVASAGAHGGRMMSELEHCVDYAIVCLRKAVRDRYSYSRDQRKFSVSSRMNGSNASLITALLPHPRVCRSFDSLIVPAGVWPLQTNIILLNLCSLHFFINRDAIQWHNNLHSQFGRSLNQCQQLVGQFLIGAPMERRGRRWWWSLCGIKIPSFYGVTSLKKRVWPSYSWCGLEHAST